MAREFSIDLTPLLRMIQESPEVVGNAAKQSMDEIKDDWVRQSRDIAPLETSNLRRQINGEVEGNGLESKIVITANATQRSNGKNFNYSYYIHEGHMANDGKKLRHEGTVEKFLEESAKEDKWKSWLKEDIQDALNREGW